MRLPTKPSQTPTITATLLMRRPSSIAVCAVSGEVLAPFTFSSRRITFAGLKKCVPTTLSGRFVAAAIASTSSVEVFVARIADGFAVRSSLPKISRFSARFSNTASMTISASFKSSYDVEPLTRPIRRSISSGFMRPFSTVPA